MGFVIKVIQTILTQYRNRGLLSTLIMNLSHLIALGRGILYKLIYIKGIKGFLFSMQGNSTIELFHRKAKLHMGKFVFIRKNVSIRIDSEGVLFLGEKVFINDNCTINCALKISIGRNTKIAPNVCINDHDHNYKKIEEGHLIKEEVIIGENVWIGSNVVVLRGTTIGDNSVIAAGSIVRGNVPPNTLFLNQRENKYIPFADENEGSIPSLISKGII